VFEEGLADAADHAAVCLAVGEPRVDDPARVEHAEHAPHPHQAQARVPRRPPHSRAP
jgi:hypothetical protein